jgi:IrrE N-terminal-like domain
MTFERSSSRRQSVAALVSQYFRYLCDRGADLAKLAEDPVGVISALGDVVVVPVDPATLPADCSVAAYYDAKSRPPRLLIAQDLTAGRRRFSTLHEYAHHLRNHVEAVIDAFWAMPDGGASIEEDLADAFAAAVLLPEDLVTAALSEGVSAAAVIRLWHASSASREACCVSAADCLHSPGYVMLLDRDGISRFAARHGDMFPIRRGSQQTASMLTAALRGGHARGIGRPHYASGTAAGEMHMDAVADGSYIFAVWVTDSPPWGGLSIPLRSAPTGLEGYCDACDSEFTSWSAACGECGDLQCPRCGCCPCGSSAALPSGRAKTRLCDRCFLMLPISMFKSDSTTCDDH